MMAGKGSPPLSKSGRTSSSLIISVIASPHLSAGGG
jgi:hypothetical protein